MLKLENYPHMIRKFFASDMYNKLDGDVLTVQKLGHASPDQTKVYILRIQQTFY